MQGRTRRADAPAGAVTLRDILPGEVFHTVESPGFLMPPPVVWHPDRIPPDALAAMQVSWCRDWFPPQPVRLCLLEDVFVAAEGLVFTAALHVVQASVKEHPPAKVALARAAIHEALKTGDMPRLRGEAVLCRKPGTRNYGHWLAEMLPRAWLAARHLPHPPRILVQAVADPLRTVMRDTLALLGIGADRVLEAGPAPLRVDRLILVDGLTEHGLHMSPLVIDCLDALAAGIAPRGGPRLLVSRGPMASRRFVDEAGVLGQAAGAGFSVLDPASVPFHAQVAAFKAAGRVVGAMGAALANLLFAPAGADALIAAPAAMPDTFFWFIGGHRGLRAVDVRCRQEGPQLGPASWDRSIELGQDDRARMFAPAAPDLPAPVTAPQAAQAMGRTFEALFDPAYYLRRNPDVAAAGADPLLHYKASGWREGRNPSAAFDGNAYLRAYPDVAGAGANPLFHYILHGQAEGREISGVQF